MATVWEDNKRCAKKYRCALTKCLIAVISSLYGIILDIAINESDHGKNVVYAINANYKRY